VKTAKVNTTFVETALGFVPPGEAATGRLQAHRHVVRKAEMNNADGFFITIFPLNKDK
jgi:hypothetical protein